MFDKCPGLNIIQEVKNKKEDIVKKDLIGGKE
jgi:hypothetical protein